MLLVFAAAACRDGVQVYEPLERDAQTTPTYQVTFSTGDDLDPSFWPGGDSVIVYHAATRLGDPVRPAYLLQPDAPGIMLRVPRVAGTALLLFPDVQRPGGGRTFVTPVVSPDGQRIAYVDANLGRVRVRRVNETRESFEDPSVAVFAPFGPGENLQQVRARAATVGATNNRPSWSPDGRNIVLSDGLRLRVWPVADSTAIAIANTERGISAAWSPDGQWIAYTHADRLTLVLMRVDGSERTELGIGEDPAWSPDGQHIYVVRGTQIVKVARQTGTATAVPNTEFGRTPAISSNGEWIAFARRKPQLLVDFDIWVAALPR